MGEHTEGVCVSKMKNSGLALAAWGGVKAEGIYIYKISFACLMALRDCADLALPFPGHGIKWAAAKSTRSAHRS